MKFIIIFMTGKLYSGILYKGALTRTPPFDFVCVQVL